MEKIENRLIDLWEIIKSKTIITIKDFEALDKEFANKFMKIQRQRERLEKSRDYWKFKYKELKKK